MSMALTGAQRKSILGGRTQPTPVSELGLRGRREAYLGSSWCAVLIDRKSRFVRKDAQAFLDLLEAARTHCGSDLAGTVLIRQAPVCSQARAMLESLGIEVTEVS